MIVPSIVELARLRVVEPGGGVGCLAVMGPAEYTEVMRWGDRYGTTYANEAEAEPGSNKILGIPVQVDVQWVGSGQILEPDAAEEYRQARRGLDKRFNPEWRLRT